MTQSTSHTNKRRRTGVQASVMSGVTLLVLAATAVIMRPGEALGIFGFSDGGKTKKEQPHTVPPEYQGKQLPSGWLADPKVLARGKKIYEGSANKAVKCALCHGVDGKPTRVGRGAPDLSDPHETADPDDLWFWRISEGVPKTTMRGWKKLLTEEQRWQVIAHIRGLARNDNH